MQNLYAREPVRLPGWVVMCSDTNYRSPTTILAHLAALLPTSYPITADSPLSGTEGEVLISGDDEADVGGIGTGGEAGGGWMSAAFVDRRAIRKMRRSVRTPECGQINVELARATLAFGSVELD